MGINWIGFYSNIITLKIYSYVFHHFLSLSKILDKLESVIEKCFKKPLFLEIEIYRKTRNSYIKALFAKFPHGKDQH